MKKEYVKPALRVRAPHVKTYVICASSSGSNNYTPEPDETNDVSIWDNQL